MSILPGNSFEWHQHSTEDIPEEVRALGITRIVHTHGDEVPHPHAYTIDGDGTVRYFEERDEQDR